MDSILLPVDFSERCVGAAHWARHLACQYGSKLTLLYVVVPPQLEFGAVDIAGSMVGELCRDHAAQAVRELDEFLAADFTGLVVRRVVLEGDPAATIVDLAHQEHIKLIVMPTHGFGPFRRFILGSITAKVLHDADCPVWTGTHIEGTPSTPAPVRRIVCAVDFGPQSRRVACWAADLARHFGAALTLMHVAACDPQLRPMAAQELTRLCSETGVEAEIAVEIGEPSRLVCAAATRRLADVLVIGRGSAAGVFGRLRTNAYAIIRESPCPVVSV
jgi:nucleotide-binding universal stress UspA family protein